MASNPFTILTPTVLDEQRKAAFEQEYQNVNPFVKLAAKAGAGIAQNERERGNQYFLSSEDQKARQNEAIMSGAQQRLAMLVKDKKMSVEEAQAEVLSGAIEQFSKAGSYEEALALAGPLHALQSQMLERRKLKAEAINLESKPDAKTIDQMLKEAKANQDYEIKLGQLAVAEQNAKTAEERLAVMVEIANIRAAMAQARLDAAADKPQKESAAQWKARRELNEGLAAASDSANLMADLREQIASSPGAQSITGDVATKIAGVATAAKTALSKQGWNPDELKEGGTASKWVQLNVDNASQRALVVQLAYAFARANDPGGRLSNQDLELAKTVVAGEGDPKARIKVLDQAFAGLARSTSSKLGAGLDMDLTPGARSNSAWQAAANRYGSLARQTGKVQTTQEAAGAPDAEGWQIINGRRVREKPAGGK